MMEMLSFEFVRYSLICGILSGVITGILSTVVVLRKMEFIGNGVAHAAFGGLALGLLLNLNLNLMAVITALAFALGVGYFSERGKVTENTAIGLMMPFSMALGVVFLSLIKGYTPDLMSYFFGNMLLVKEEDVILLSLMTLCVSIFFIVFNREILYYTFDETMSKHYGVPVNFVKYSMLILISLVIVASVKIIGIILVTSMLVAPAAISRLFSRRFKTMVLNSILMNVLSVLIGITWAYYLNVPPGPAIVITLFSMFVLISMFKRIRA